MKSIRILIALGLLVLLQPAAAAHDHSIRIAPGVTLTFWIEEGDYRDPWGVQCCGPGDCSPALPGEIVKVPGAWLHVPTGTTIPDTGPGAYASQRPEMWRCVRGGQLKCVFWTLGV